MAFAACQNEEFESANSPELSKAQRPLVEVKLDFQKEADTRISYDGLSYGWQSTDRIGALLMDEVASSNRPFGNTANDWAKESWLQHYTLVDYIHTAYPFSYNTTTKVWEAPSKLQEGNYFFAAPYDTYEGQRQLIHYLDKQVQTGSSEKAMNSAIAANQYFIGYAQVIAGTENKEALKSVVMAPVLAPVKVTLRNIGTLDKHVEKVIIRGSKIATALTINPTDAQYGGTKENGSIQKNSKYNLRNSSTFNYANFIGSQDDNANKDAAREALYVNTDKNDKVFVYNIESGATDYSRTDAIRQMVKPVYNSAENAVDAQDIEKQAILSFTKPLEIVANGGEIHFAVMVTTQEEISEDDALEMDIITTEGQITKIDLTTLQKSENNMVGDHLKANTVITNNAFKTLKPNTENEIIIQFDNNSVVAEDEIEAQDEATLLAFIKWNKENARLNTATLLKDVTFTKEMYDALKATGYKGTLAIKKATGEPGKLLVADNVPVDVLNLLDKTTDATIVLNGTRTLTKTVADKLNGVGLTVENRGTLNIGAEEVVAYVQLNNFGTIKVAKDGELKGTTKNLISNYGMLENLGSIYNVNNSVDAEGEAKGWIKTSSTGVNHINSNAQGATIQLVKISDELQLPDKNNSGTIYLDTDSDVKGSELTEQRVNKLRMTAGTIKLDEENNKSVEELIIEVATGKTVAIEGWNNLEKANQASAYHEFTSVVKATIDGNVTFQNAGITGASTTTFNSGKVTFTHADKVTATNKLYDVLFVKGVTVNVDADTEVIVNEVKWNGNSVTNMGTFKYATSAGKVNLVAGNSLKQEMYPTETPKPEVTKYYISVTIDENNTASNPEITSTDKENPTAVAVTNLKELVKLVEATETKEFEITNINISTDLTLSEEEEDNNYYDYFKKLANGKNVTLDADLKGLKQNMGVSVGKLTIGKQESTAKYISGDVNNKLGVVLTITAIDYTEHSFYTTNCRIMINEEGKLNDTSLNILGKNEYLKGTIIDNTLKYVYKNGKWALIE